MLQIIRHSFNPRTPRGVRLNRLYTELLTALFQSTHPARGATYCQRSFDRWHPCFNPRTPRGVRRSDDIYQMIINVFQSTHPARGATGTLTKCFKANLPFQSTHPARGATSPRRIQVRHLRVSIHAPRAGCDSCD